MQDRRAPRTRERRQLRILVVCAVLLAAFVGTAAPAARAATAIDAHGPYYGGVGTPTAMQAGVTDPPILAYSIRWNFGDGSTGTGGTVSHTYAVAGNYNATASVVILITNTVVASDTASVRIANIEANGPYSGSTGTALQFHANVINPPPVMYTVQWDFGDGVVANGAVLFHTYTMMGNYMSTARLLIGGNTVAQDSAAVTIAGTTTVDAGGPYSGAVNTPITFSAVVNNGPPGYSIVWGFGDGTQGSGEITTHAYTAPGVYAVTATVYQGIMPLASDSTTAAVSGAATSVEAGGPYTGAVNAPIAFSATVSNPPPGYTVVWTFGDGTSAMGTAVTHTYGATGTYSVTVTVYQGATAIASDSSTAVVTPVVAPVSVEADGPYNGIVGQPINFTATVNNPPPGYSVGWSFGDGSTGSGAATSHSYGSAGIYTAIVTVYQGGMAIVSDSTSVTVTPAPPAGPSVTYAAGWNIVAGPAGMAFPQASGPLYTYQAGDMAYEVLANTTGVASGRGYWAYFTAPTTVMLAGAGASTASVPAPAGQWVMVGNPSPLQMVGVHGADLVVRYDLSTNSYVPVTTLAPGQGAWAISLSGGMITLQP